MCAGGKYPRGYPPPSSHLILSYHHSHDISTSLRPIRVHHSSIATYLIGIDGCDSPHSECRADRSTTQSFPISSLCFRFISSHRSRLDGNDGSDFFSRKGRRAQYIQCRGRDGMRMSWKCGEMWYTRDRIDGHARSLHIKPGDPPHLHAPLARPCSC